jgi:hypothetical protein
MLKISDVSIALGHGDIAVPHCDKCGLILWSHCVCGFDTCIVGCCTCSPMGD